MIEDKDVKIAESPREALISTTIENTKSRIRQSELALELDKVVLKYLEEKKNE